jgi:hypothetical protein
MERRDVKQEKEKKNGHLSQILQSLAIDAIFFEGHLTGLDNLVHDTLVNLALRSVDISLQLPLLGAPTWTQSLARTNSPPLDSTLCGLDEGDIAMKKEKC